MLDSSDKSASPLKSKGCLVLALALIAVSGFGIAIKFYISHKTNQRIERRTNMPPHLVAFDHLKRIPEGEPYVDKESVIVDGYIIAPTQLSEKASNPSFYFSDSYLPKDDSEVKFPQASIFWCDELRKVNCFNAAIDKSGVVPYFGGLYFIGNSGEKIPAIERVRLHGKLNIREDKDSVFKIIATLEVTAIERPDKPQ